MAKEIGLNTNIEAGAKRLHIQSSFFKETNKINTSVFEKGMLIGLQEFSLYKEYTPAQIKKQVTTVHDTVVKDLQKLYDLADKVKGTSHIKSYERLGTLFLAKGFYDDAREQFLYVRDRTMNPASCAVGLGVIHFKKSDFDQALLEFKQALDKKEKSFNLYFYMARTYSRMGDISTAYKYFQELVAYFPNHVDGIFYLALFLLQSIIDDHKEINLGAPEERLGEAKHLLRKTIELSTSYNREKIETSLENLSDIEKINDNLPRLLEAKGDDDSYQKEQIVINEFYLKFMYEELYDDKDQLSEFMETIERDKGENNEMNYILGLANIAKAWQHFGDSIKIMREIIDKDPNWAPAQKGLKLSEYESRGLLLILRALFK